MNYTVNVAEEGEYTVSVRASEEGEVEAGTVHASLSNEAGDAIDIEVGTTGAWDVYGEFKQNGKIKLPAGESTIRLTIKKSWVNIDRLTFTKWDPSDVDDTEAEKILIIKTDDAIKFIGIDGVETLGRASQQQSPYGIGHAVQPLRIEIINAEGKTIRVSNKTEIPTSGIVSGIYTIRIITDSNVICKKFTLK